jgi:predicted nucleic acid-binding protein
LARRGPDSYTAGAATLAETLEGLVIVELDESMASIAATVEPSQLRSLDAIHLASALALGPDLETFVSYDARLADAARAAGLTVVAPA